MRFGFNAIFESYEHRIAGALIFAYVSLVS